LKRWFMIHAVHKLIEVRKAKNLTLDDISFKTKIRTEILARIESGDTSFQPEPYMKALLKKYGDALGTKVSFEEPAPPLVDTPMPSFEEMMAERKPATQTVSAAVQPVMASTIQSASEPTVKQPIPTSFGLSSVEPTQKPSSWFGYLMLGSVSVAAIVAVIVWIAMPKSETFAVVRNEPSMMRVEPSSQQVSPPITPLAAKPAEMSSVNAGSPSGANAATVTPPSVPQSASQTSSQTPPLLSSSQTPTVALPTESSVKPLVSSSASTSTTSAPAVSAPPTSASTPSGANASAGNASQTSPSGTPSASAKAVTVDSILPPVSQKSDKKFALVVRAKFDSCWVGIASDKHSRKEAVIPPSNTMQFDADSTFTVTLGKVESVELWLNGKQLSLPKRTGSVANMKLVPAAR
jgi:transcriptional regulator with XRE-family HTH domain